KKEQVADWFYRARWEQVPLATDLPAKAQNWLILPDATGIGEQIAARLQHQGQTVVSVYPGSGFAQLEDLVCQVRPQESDDYTQLCTMLSSQGKLPGAVWHGWNVTGLQ